MNYKNKILNTITTFTKTFPPYRKFNEIYNLINTIFLKLGATSIVTAKMIDGTSMIVDLTTRTERKSYYTGRYDSDILKIIHSLIDTDSVFLNIGANIGFYSVSISNYFRSQKSKGKVISFEPLEGNFLRLYENIKVNELNSYCILNQYGLSDKSNEVLITLREDFRLGSSTGNAAILTSEKMDHGFKWIQRFKMCHFFQLKLAYNSVSKCAKIERVKKQSFPFQDVPKRCI